MHGLRWVILAYRMSSQTSWRTIPTRHNCTMVSGGGSRDLIWQSVTPLADRKQDGEYACQGNVWTAFDLGNLVWDRLRKKRRCTKTQWSLAARRCLFSWGLDTVVGHAVLIAWNGYPWFVWISWRYLNHIIVLCGTLNCLARFAVLKLRCSIPTALSLSTIVRP